MDKHEAMLKSIQFVTQTIAALSTRQCPPAMTLSGLQTKLDAMVNGLISSKDKSELVEALEGDVELLKQQKAELATCIEGLKENEEKLVMEIAGWMDKDANQQIINAKENKIDGRVIAKARDKYFADNPGSLKLSTLGTDPKYLRNRIEAAFIAGVDMATAHLKKATLPAKECDNQELCKWFPSSCDDCNGELFELKSSLPT